MSFNLAITIGLAGGLGLPFITELGTALLVIIILIYASAFIGTFFLRETKNEHQLRNIYNEIYPDNYERIPSPLKSTPSFSKIDQSHQDGP